MNELLSKLKNNAHIAISVPAVLCSITFVTNLVQALSDGNIDSNEFHSLSASADGLESVILFVVMLALKRKNK